MNQAVLPSAPLGHSSGVTLPPPSYDEAMANTASAPRDQIPNNVQISDTLQDENELKKREQKKEAPPLATAPPPPMTTQPLPVPETTYSFQQPITQQPRPADDCCLFCYCNPDDIADICYCIFCCSRHRTQIYIQDSRHVTGHDAGCCDLGDGFCGCPEGCCSCCDCDCGDCDCGGCDCGDCDCGDCDCGGCDCDCGDCTIL